MWDEITGVKKVSPLTIFHICSSHFIHTCLKKIVEHIEDDDLCNLASRAMTMLIHSPTLEEGSLIMENFVKIFGTKERPKDINAAIKFFDSVEKTHPIDEPDESEIKDRCDISEDSLIHEDAQKDSSFYRFFQ